MNVIEYIKPSSECVSPGIYAFAVFIYMKKENEKCRKQKLKR